MTALLLLAALANSFPASAGEGVAPARGYPLIREIQPEIFGADAQNFDIAADSRGLLFVANVGGALVYDGASWRSTEVGTARIAFSIAVNPNGKVAVGGVDELGSLTTDERGQLRYSSLVPLLPKDTGILGQVGSTVPHGEGFLFLSEQALLSWDGGEHMEVLARFSGEPPFPYLGSVEGTMYFASGNGLTRLLGSRFEPVPGGEAFRGKRIDQVWQTHSGLAVSVRGEGLFVLHEGQARPFAAAASAWAIPSRVFGGTPLPDGRFALGSIRGGVLVLDPAGEVSQLIDTRVGLKDDYVSALAVDTTGELWLALNSGLARLEVSSPLSVFDRRSGLAGSIYTATRHAGLLLVGTPSGTYRSAAAEAGASLRFAPAPGLTEATWSFMSRDGELLVGTSRGVFVEREGRAVTHVPDLEDTVYAMAASPSDPARVWLGLERGVGILRRDPNGSWQVERRIEDIHSSVRQVIEREGALWCGTETEGVVRISLPLPMPSAPAPTIERLGEATTYYLFRAAGKLVAVHRGGILAVDEQHLRLVEDPAFAPFRGLGPFTHLAEDATGNLWLNTRPPVIAPKNATGWGPSFVHLAALPGQSFDFVLLEANGAVWLSSEGDLYRHDGAQTDGRTPLPAPLVAKVTDAQDQVLAAASFTALPPALTLAPHQRRLRLTFAPRSFVPGLRYSTRLDPVDEDWGAPHAEPFVELTRLPAGNYTLNLRSVGPGGEMSPATSWSFRVLAPWYQTPWAFLAWAGLAVVLVRGYSRVRHRALRQRAAALEARVSEKTSELSRAVAELSQTKLDLEAANAQLAELAERDELTGLANRRRLRPSLAAEWSRGLREGESLAFILLDLDHFKELNDALGHAAGDRCLAEVARFLTGRIRRAGDLLVRYGGEEFAILLPDTDLAGAERLAEELRAGLEALALPHPTATSGRVTASFGVAAEVPTAASSPETLIAAADQALYRAKDAGRNRVGAYKLLSVLSNFTQGVE